MAEYAKGYEGRTDWMHQSGVDEIRAAVVARAVLDYVEACKTVIALSGEFTGRNVTEVRDKKIRNWTYRHRKYKTITLEEHIIKETYRESVAAQNLCDDIERFFTSPVFLEFCDNSTGDLILEEARRFVREWAEDRNSGRWNLSTNAVDDSGYAQSIKNGRYDVYRDNQRERKQAARKSRKQGK